MAPKGKKTVAPQPSTSRLSAPKAPVPEPKTIGEKRLAGWRASRPYQGALDRAKSDADLTSEEKTNLGYEVLLLTGSWRNLGLSEQAKFKKHCETHYITKPLPRPESLGKDWRGRNIDDYTLEEFAVYEKEQEALRLLESKSFHFALRYKESRENKLRASYKKSVGNQEKREIIDKGNYNDVFDAGVDVEGFMTWLNETEAKSETITTITKTDILAEKLRRVEMAQIKHEKAPGIYAGDPDWDDITPLPQDDGEKPLAAIAYSDEYSEAISYLRAVMAIREYSPRVLDLTAHVIDLNPAHYTVWLYRASTLFALESNILAELEWVNEVALDNQKNYQIWHHRQLLIDTLFPTLCDSRAKVLDLAHSELNFMNQMFARDSKNYHVWSYRQWLVRKLKLFPSQCDSPSEIKALEDMLLDDVRNNSAWSHRFFVVFSDPAHSTPGSKATEMDDRIPNEIIRREIKFAQAAVHSAPQNQSPWNYMRGVLKKGGGSIVDQQGFAEEFVQIKEVGEEDVRSSHALEFLADVWTEKGELEKANKALTLLGKKYDQVRKNYWEWKRNSLI